MRDERHGGDLRLEGDVMASRRAQRRRECGKKLRYASKTDAEAFIALKRWHGLHAYSCPWCGGVHVGHIPKAVRAANAAKARKAGFR